MNNGLPDGWSLKKFGELSLFKGGNAFKETYQGNRTGSYPFIKVSDMNLLGNEKFIKDSSNWINEDIKIETKVTLFSKDVVVFAKVGAALLLNRRRILTRDTAIDNNMMAAVSICINNAYLYYLLQAIDFSNFVQSGAIPSINQGQLEVIPVLSPPLPEQQKIAKILTSVDEVIETTETQINKLKDLEKGMMNELLTKGIGHTEFKDSAVGRIPVGWEVKEFQEVSNVIDSLHQTPVFSSTGFPMVRVSDIKQGKIKLEYTQKVKEDVFLQFTKKYLPVLGDLLISRVGSYGVCSIVDTEQQFCLGQNTAIIHPTTVLSKFLYYWIYSPSIFEQVENEVAGSSYKSLSLATIRKLNIAIPSKLEQEKIANIIWSIDTNIEQKQTKLTQSKNLKKSLMADLLTGKVRVKPNQELTELS